MKQLLRLNFPIDKGEATNMPMLQLCKSGLCSGPYDLTPQLPIVGENVLLVMIAIRLGKILLWLACARCCGRRSVHTCVMIRHLGPSLAYPVS